MGNFALILDPKLYEQMKDMRLLLKPKQVMQNLQSEIRRLSQVKGSYSFFYTQPNQSIQHFHFVKKLTQPSFKFQ